eukprot:215901-Chlamydomonas_euryale.AAC.1
MHTRAHLVSRVHAHRTVHDRRQPLWLARGVHARVQEERVEAVRLEVGLVHQVEAVHVAQLVPLRGTGVEAWCVGRCGMQRGCVWSRVPPMQTASLFHPIHHTITQQSAKP